MRSRSHVALWGMSLLATATVAVAAIDGPVGRDAEKGDPARWYQPIETPQQQHRNAMQEAAAALAEALKECRAATGGRMAPAGECEVQAREQYEQDVERARGFLVRSSLG